MNELIIENVLSDFDGIGGARQAFSDIGITPKRYFASEIDKYAIQIAMKNYPDIEQVGDITKLYARNLPKINLMIGGSPCQDLSIAKKGREGLKGARSGLFWHYVRLLRTCKPEYFILENVASMPKEAMERISKELGVYPVMINSALLTAQNRKRYYWVGRLEDGKYKQVFIPQPQDKGIVLKDILEKEVDIKYNINPNIIEKYSKNGIPKNFKGNEEKSVSLTASSSKGYGNDNCTSVKIGHIGNTDGQGNRVYSSEGKSVSLQANAGGLGAKTGLYLTENQIDKIKYLKGAKTEKRIKNGFEYTYKEGALSLTNENKKSLPLLASCSGGISRSTNYIEDNYSIRKLTPIECERLQGFPDNYTEGISNTQRYKCLGNSFTVPVIAHILKEIFKAKER